MEGPAILDWESPVDAGRPRLPSDAARHAQLLADLASAADLTDISTFGDLLVAMERFGLLGRLGDDRLVPNPAPPLIWDVLGRSDADAHPWRLGVAMTQERSTQSDVLHLLRWAAEGTLRASPLRMALRLARPVQQVLDALRALQLLDRIQVDQPLDGIDPSQLIRINPQRA